MIFRQKKKKLKSVYKNAVELVLIGGLTGVFVGLVVTLYGLLAHEGETLSQGVYAYVRENPAFIPLLFIALVLGAFLLGVAVRVTSAIRGVGIPQAEGATRGIIKLRWWRDAIAMFAASLLSVFMGLSIGSEGPSVFIGASLGDGVATLTKRNQMIRRYQITGGACAGLAVAANAPLTGMAFAFEEAHKRFTPEVFICAFSSVIFALLTRTAVCSLFGADHSLSSSFHSYLYTELPLRDYWIVAVSAIICSIVGISFYKLSFKIRKLFKKIRFENRYWRYTTRFVIVAVLGGALGLITANVMGGGHGLIENIGTNGGLREMQVETVFGLSMGWSLFIVLVMKLFVTSVNVGSGIPCGIFIPIIAMGACIGGLLNEMWVSSGVMDKSHADLLVMICMATFFTVIVRAPLTGIIMTIEFTWSFAPLLPVIIGVSIGYIIGDLTRTEGIYEDLLAAYERETGVFEHAEKEVFHVTVQEGCIGEKRSVRDILWPADARVTQLVRGHDVILPDADTELKAGDVLTVVCRTDEPDKIRDDLAHMFE